MAVYETTFEKDEKILLEEAANLIVNQSGNARGGHMALTARRVIFQAHKLNIGKKFEEFSFGEIKRNEQGAYYVFVKGNNLLMQMNDNMLVQFVLKAGRAEVVKGEILRLLSRVKQADNTILKKSETVSQQNTSGGDSNARIKADVKGFFGKMKDGAIKGKQEAAIRKAYRIEEEKRKPHIKKIRHERALTPQEQQTIDMIKMERDAKIAEWSRQGVSFFEATFTRALPYDNRIKEIEERCVWYEEIVIPPEVDPDVPIEIDEEAIRKSISSLL